MADLCSIEQELSKPISKASDSKSRQRPTGRSASTKHTGGGSSGGSTSSSTRASPASTVRGGSSSQSRPLASNFSLDDITAQLEKASQSMDEAAKQTSESSSSSSSSYSSATLSHPPSNSHHRRTGSVGTVSDQEVRSIGHSSRSSVNSASASSMDSLDIRGQENEAQSQNQNQSQTSTEVTHTHKHDIKSFFTLFHFELFHSWHLDSTLFRHDNVSITDQRNRSASHCENLRETFQQSET